MGSGASVTAVSRATMRCLSRRWRPWSGLFATRLQVSPQPVHMFPTICGFSGNTLDAVIAVFKTSCCRSKVSRSHRRQGSSLGIWPTREKHVSLSSVAGRCMHSRTTPPPDILRPRSDAPSVYQRAPWVPLQYPMNTNKLLLLLRRRRGAFWPLEGVLSPLSPTAFRR